MHKSDTAKEVRKKNSGNLKKNCTPKTNTACLAGFTEWNKPIYRMELVGTKLASHFCCLIASFSSPDPAFQVNPDPVRIQGFDDQKLLFTYL
jgi:hypothetical protein